VTHNWDVWRRLQMSGSSRSNIHKLSNDPVTQQRLVGTLADRQTFLLGGSLPCHGLLAVVRSFYDSPRVGLHR
jgi:hypothetical protein